MSTVTTTPIALVVAAARNGVIGADNQLPWRLPGDLRHFKAVTMGKPVVMGRKTFDSIGRALPGRLNIVITRDTQYAVPDGVELAHSLDVALQRADAAAQTSGAAEIAVIGGADIYRQTLPLATTVYLTRVELDVAGDAFFPALDARQWQCVASEAQAEGEVVYHLERYQRLRG